MSDYGTVTMETPYEVFLGSVVGLLCTVLPALVSVSSFVVRRIFLPDRAFHLSPGQPLPGKLTLLRPSLGNDASTVVPEY